MATSTQTKKTNTRTAKKRRPLREKRESGIPGGGQGRRDIVGRSGVYPASGPLPPGDAPLQPMGSLGQGARGAQGYNDGGDSEIFFVGAELTAKEQVGAPGPGEPPTRKMKKREIPRQEWLDFVDRFSEQHEGWLSTLYTIDGDHQRLILARDLPLQAVAASLGHGDRETISISFANSRTTMIEHNQSNVEHVYLLQNPDGAHAGLLLEGFQQERTLLLFRSPMLPEPVDGVMTRP